MLRNTVRHLLAGSLVFATLSCGGDDNLTFEAPFSGTHLVVTKCCVDDILSGIEESRLFLSKNVSMPINAASNKDTGPMTDVTDQATWTNESPSIITLSSTSVPCQNRPSRRCRIVTNLSDRNAGARIKVTWKGMTEYLTVNPAF